jgi:hypothetical protein
VTECQLCFLFVTLNDKRVRKEETEIICFHEDMYTRGKREFTTLVSIVHLIQII